MKNNNKTLIKIIEENREEIIELSKASYRKTMDGSCFHGWSVGVAIDVDGDIWDFCRSMNSMSTSEYEGNAVAVVNYTAGSEVPEVFINKEDLTEEETEDFKDWLLANEYVEDIEEWESELNYMRVNEFNSDITYRMDLEAIEFEVDNCYREVAEDKIEKCLETLRLSLS